MATASQELKAHVQALQGIMTKPEAAEQVKTILEALKSGAAPSEENLRATKAGFYVGKLRSHNNSDVKRLAAEIVHKWKKAVEVEKKKSGGSPTSSSKPAAAAAVATPPASSPKPAPKPALSAKFTGDPEKRKWQNEGVDPTGKTPDKSRDNCLGLLYNGLAYLSTEPAAVIMNKAQEVERACFSAYSGDGTSVTETYLKRVRTLFANLKNRQQGGKLGKKVMTGEYSADDFVRLDEEQLKSDKQKEEERKMEEENLKNAQVPMPQKSISTALECGKCKQKKVTYSQAQTRSADEPMTTFCECLICGNRWKFS